MAYPVRDFSQEDLPWGTYTISPVRHTLLYTQQYRLPAFTPSLTDRLYFQAIILYASCQYKIFISLNNIANFFNQLQYIFIQRFQFILDHISNGYHISVFK